MDRYVSTTQIDSIYEKSEIETQTSANIQLFNSALVSLNRRSRVLRNTA
jgi:hypothetical protein